MSIELALKIAQANPVEGLPQMAAVISKRKKVIAVGMNSRKTDPLAAKFGKNPDAICKHAEIDAIKNALRIISVDELEDCTISIARVMKDGSAGLAKPCKGCQRAIDQFGFRKVYWTK